MPLTYDQITKNSSMSLFTFTARDISDSVIQEFSLYEKARKITERITELCKHDFERFGDTPNSRNFLCYDNLMEWLTNNTRPLPEILGIGLNDAEFDICIRDVAQNLIRSRIMIDFSTFPNASRSKGYINLNN